VMTCYIVVRSVKQRAVAQEPVLDSSSASFSVLLILTFRTFHLNLKRLVLMM
jgi:hypothetical protein